LKKGKLDLLIWTSSFNPVVGGLQTATYEIAQNFKKQKNWNVQVLTNKYPRKLKSKEIISQIQVKRYTFLSNPLVYLKTSRIDLLLAYTFLKPITFIQLIIYFIVNRPKIVNLHFPDHQLLECVILQKIFRFKLIVSLHGNDVERMKELNNRSLKYFLYSKLFNMSLIITGSSKFLIREFQQLNIKIKKVNYFILHNGVKHLFRNHQLNLVKANYYFTAARLAPSKGINILEEVTKHLLDEQFKLAGINKTDYLNKMAQNVKLLGELSVDKIGNNLSSASITIVPSIVESFGIIVAEALCCGSPVVATNVGGIPEVIALATEKLNDKEMYIFNCWVKLVNPVAQSIIVGIESIKNNNSNIEDFITIIPKIREQFSWENRMQRYNQILHGL
jgi:glycosyltransferase involved in cell wall biosynthesis